MWQKSTKNYVLIIIVLIITGIFIITSVDVLSIFSPKLGQNTLYKFKNGNEVTVYDLQRHISQSQEKYSDIEEAIKGLMHKALLEQLLKEYKLQCSNEYIATYTQKNLFQGEDSKFSQAKFNEALKNLHLSQRQYCNLVSNELLRQALFANLLNQGLIVSNAQIEQLKLHFLQERNIELVEVDLLQNKDNIANPTEEEKKDLFEKESLKFLVPEKRSFLYCKLPYKNHFKSFSELKKAILGQASKTNSIKAIEQKFNVNTKKLENLSFDQISSQGINEDIKAVWHNIFNMQQNDHFEIFESRCKEAAILIKILDVKKQHKPTLQEAEMKVIDEYKNQHAKNINSKKLIDFFTSNKKTIENDNKKLASLLDKNIIAKIQTLTVGKISSPSLPAKLIESIIYDIDVGHLTPIVKDCAGNKAYFALIKQKISNPKYEKYSGIIEQSLNSRICMNILYELIEYLASKEEVQQNGELIQYISQNYKNQNQKKEN
jgi:hypothetical protein